MADPFAGFQPAPDPWEGFEQAAPNPPLSEELKQIPPGFVQGAKEYAGGLGDVARAAAATAFPSLDPGAGPAPEPQGGGPGYNLGRFLGGGAASVPVSYMMPGSMSENLLSRLASGAAGGALTGAAQSPNNMGEGALLGAVGGAAPGVRPSISEAAQGLIEKGVRPSVGQMVGGTLNDWEQELTSMPGIGDAIKNIRRGAVNDLNVAQANAALSHIGDSLDPKTTPGRGMIAEMDRKIGAVYDQILPSVSWQPDAQTVPNIMGAIQGANLTDQKQTQLMNLIKTQFSKAGNNNVMSGDLFKEIDSKFGKEAADFIGSQDPDQAKYGAAALAVQGELRDTLARANPQFGDALNKANAAWADASRLRYASAMAGSKEGVFGPAQLSAGVKHEALSQGQFAHGQARMQDVSDAAQKVLGPTVPESGTFPRMMMGLGGPFLGAPMAAAALPEVASKYVLPAAMANMAGAAMYTRPGQAVARGMLRLAPKISPLASAGLAGILSQRQQ